MCSHTYTCTSVTPPPPLYTLINKNSLKFFKHLNLNYMYFPTYKHGNYTKLMQIKLLTASKSIEIALKYTKMTKSKKTSKRRQKLDLGMEP